MANLKVLVKIVPRIVTFSHFRFTICSLHKYLEISYYHDNAIMKNFLITIMTFHDNRLYTIISQHYTHSTMRFVYLFTIQHMNTKPKVTNCAYH